MAIYSVLLAAGRVQESMSRDVYTAPAAGVVVVRDIIICSDLGETGGVGVDVISWSVSTPIYHTNVADLWLSYQWQGRQVLLAGDVLRVTTLDGACRYRVSGYLLGG